MSQHKSIEEGSIEPQQNTLEQKPRWTTYLTATRTDVSQPEIPRVVVSMYALITVTLALLSTIQNLSVPLINTTIGLPANLIIPQYVYFYAIFGTTAYIFANKIGRSDTLRSRQAFFRVFAVLPTVAGVYLLWSMLWPDVSASAAGVAGIAFLTGLFVEVFLQALATLTDRVVPQNSSTQEPNSQGAK